MRQRARIRMSQEEVREFLLANPKLQVATNGPDGTPHLTTLFHTLVDDRPTFWTYARSQKAVNLRRDPRLAVLVEAGESYEELRGVLLRGRAEIIDEPSRVLQLGLRIAGGDGETDAARRQVVTAQASKRIVVRVHPIHTVSWDHRKLA